MNQREKAARKVFDAANLSESGENFLDWYRDVSDSDVGADLAIDLQVENDRAVHYDDCPQLRKRTADWLSRNERKEG